MYQSFVKCYDDKQLKNCFYKVFSHKLHTEANFAPLLEIGILHLTKLFNGLLMIQHYM